MNANDIIIGCLLGDGHLEKRYKETHNSCFSYTSSKNEHVNYVKNKLIEFVGDKYKKNIDHAYVYDKRKNKSYERYFFRTKHNSFFTKLRMKWYPDGKKIVPNDLILNSTICLFWYIGDGSLINGKRTQEIRLSTNCFTLNEVDFLIKQLKIFNAKKIKDKNQYKIRIQRRYVKDFLNYIGKCPINEYKYKWDYKEYKNKLRFINYKLMIPEFIDEYMRGVSYYSIAKKRNIEPNIVKYYLKKNGVLK